MPLPVRTRPDLETVCTLIETSGYYRPKPQTETEAIQVVVALTTRTIYAEWLNSLHIDIKQQLYPQGQDWIEYLYLLLATPPYYQYGRC